MTSHVAICYAVTGNFNALSHDDDGDTITFVQTELCEYRQSEDRTVNAFGRLLLEICAELDLRILDGACRGDEEGHFHMFVLQAVVL